MFGYGYREQKRLNRNREKEKKRQKQRESDLRAKAVKNQEDLKAERKEYKRKQKIKHDSEKRRENHKLKVKLLSDSGIDLFGLTYKDIEKVSMAEVKNGKLKPDTIYKFRRYAFNWDKVYSLEPERLYVAFQDFAGERDLKDILSEQKSKSNSQLLYEIHTIVNMPLTYRRGKNTSSGRAGSAIFACGSGGKFGTLWDDYIKVRSYNNHINSLLRHNSGKIRYKGERNGWQVLKWGSKSTTDSITPRIAIEIINGLMWNVTELERGILYASFMRMVRNHMEDLIEFLPEDNGGW